ncbi:hypothetical protein AAHZ94_30795, partial [Streptomyces sp. HSW2009]
MNTSTTSSANPVDPARPAATEPTPAPAPTERTRPLTPPRSPDPTGAPPASGASKASQATPAPHTTPAPETPPTSETAQVTAFLRGLPGAAEPHTGAAPVVLADRFDATVVRLGPRVAKAHPADADPAALLTRLRIAAHPSLRTSLLAPLPIAAPGHPAPHPERATAPDPPAGAVTTPALLAPLPGGRLVSLWPYGAPVAPDERDAVPWEALGELLARLHRVPVDALPGPVPPMYGPAKVARALRRLRAAHPAVAPALAPARRWGAPRGPTTVTGEDLASPAGAAAWGLG